MSGSEDSLYALEWNNNISVAAITLVSYEYILQLDKEATFVWERQWSAMTYLYLAVRYFGILIAITCACWGGLFYISEAPYVRIVMVYFYFSNGVSLYIFAWRKSFSFGVFTPYTTNPSPCFIF